MSSGYDESDADSGSKEITEMLLKAGAEINATSFGSIFPETGGETPLMLAAKENRPDMVKVLLQHGCDIDKMDWAGKTALHYSCRSGSKEIPEMLLQAGAKINVQSGRTGCELRQAKRKKKRNDATLKIQEEFSHLEECRRNNHCGRKFSLPVERLIKIVEQSVLFQPAGIENLYTDELKQLQQLLADFEIQRESQNQQSASCGTRNEQDSPGNFSLIQKELNGTQGRQLFPDGLPRELHSQLQTDYWDLPKSAQEDTPDTCLQMNSISKALGNITPPPGLEGPPPPSKRPSMGEGEYLVYESSPPQLPPNLPPQRFRPINETETRFAELNLLDTRKLDKLCEKLLERDIIDEDQLDDMLDLDDKDQKIEYLRKILLGKEISTWEREFSWAFDYIS